MRTRGLGVSLIEMVVFIVIVSFALAALMAVYNQSVSRSVDPVVQVRLLELAQSKLDEVMARKFDHNTPSGGVPSCNGAGGPACTAAIGREGAESCAAPAGLNDVDDFDGCNQTNGPATYPNYGYSISVSYAGTELGLASNTNAKRIEVNVSAPTGDVLALTSYRANF